MHHHFSPLTWPYSGWFIPVFQTHHLVVPNDIRKSRFVGVETNNPCGNKQSQTIPDIASVRILLQRVHGYLVVTLWCSCWVPGCKGFDPPPGCWTGMSEYGCAWKWDHFDRVYRSWWQSMKFAVFPLNCSDTSISLTTKNYIPEDWIPSSLGTPKSKFHWGVESYGYWRF